MNQQFGLLEDIKNDGVTDFYRKTRYNELRTQWNVYCATNLFQSVVQQVKDLLCLEPAQTVTIDTLLKKTNEIMPLHLKSPLLMHFITCVARAIYSKMANIRLDSNSFNIFMFFYVDNFRWCSLTRNYRNRFRNLTDESKRVHVEGNMAYLKYEIALLLISDIVNRLNVPTEMCDIIFIFSSGIRTPLLSNHCLELIEENRNKRLYRFNEKRYLASTIRPCGNSQIIWLQDLTAWEIIKSSDYFFHYYGPFLLAGLPFDRPARETWRILNAESLTFANRIKGGEIHLKFEHPIGSYQNYFISVSEEHVDSNSDNYELVGLNGLNLGGGPHKVLFQIKGSTDPVPFPDCLKHTIIFVLLVLPKKTGEKEEKTYPGNIRFVSKDYHVDVISNSESLTFATTVHDSIFHFTGVLFDEDSGSFVLSIGKEVLRLICDVRFTL